MTDLISLIGGDQIIFPDSDILANSNAEVVFPGGAGKASKGSIVFPDEGPGNNDFVAEADKGRVLGLVVFSSSRSLGFSRQILPGLRVS